jgi:uncharacterized Zn-binding protein involved in type VI secretion
MGMPAAKQGDQVMAIDLHIVVSASGSGPVPLPFTGIIDGSLSADVNIMGIPAATLNSTATNTPGHVPPPGSTFPAMPPSNRATITTGSATVFINGKAAARNGDTATTCNDPVDLPVGTVVAAGTVNIG